MEKKYRIRTNGSRYRIERLSVFGFWPFRRERWEGLDKTMAWDYWYANQVGRYREFASKKECEEFIKAQNWYIAQEIVI